MAIPTEIDSREYVFAYLIRSAADIPADFPIPEPERLGPCLFLPRDDPDWFGRRGYPPRILMLDGNLIVVLTHPYYNEPCVRLALEDIEFYETGHLLLIGWIRFVTAQSGLCLPYNTRSDHEVNEFLDALGDRYFARGREYVDELSGFFGPPLDIKFKNCLAAVLRKHEHVCATWFSPPHERYRRWAPFRIRSEIGGDLVALTDMRILWITDRWNRRYERYGSVASATPVRRLAGALVLRDNPNSALVIRLRSGTSWSIPFPSERYAEAEAFARKIEAAVIPGALPIGRSEGAQT